MARPTEDSPEIEVTPEMIEAGAHALLSEGGVAPLGVFFSPDELAEKVYRAMQSELLQAEERGSR